MATVPELWERKVEEARPAGMWAWFLQRVTAALIVIFLGIHWGVLHFIDVGTKITFSGVSERLALPLFVVVDYGLLALVLFHGLNGIATVIMDFNPGPTTRKAIYGILWAIGLVTFAYKIP